MLYDYIINMYVDSSSTCSHYYSFILKMYHVQDGKAVKHGLPVDGVSNRGKLDPHKEEDAPSVSHGKPLIPRSDLAPLSALVVGGPLVLGDELCKDDWAGAPAAVVWWCLDAGESLLVVSESVVQRCSRSGSDAR